LRSGRSDQNPPFLFAENGILDKMKTESAGEKGDCLVVVADNQRNMPQYLHLWFSTPTEGASPFLPLHVFVRSMRRQNELHYEFTIFMGSRTVSQEGNHVTQ